jgi:hypothetical protein
MNLKDLALIQQAQPSNAKRSDSGCMPASVAGTKNSSRIVDSSVRQVIVLGGHFNNFGAIEPNNNAYKKKVLDISG